jgi:hypothetical protein
LASAPELQKKPRGERVRHQPLGQPLAGLGAEQVGHVHEPARSASRIASQPRVAVAERVDGDARS